QCLYCNRPRAISAWPARPVLLEPDHHSVLEDDGLAGLAVGPTLAGDPVLARLGLHRVGRTEQRAHLVGRHVLADGAAPRGSRRLQPAIDRLRLSASRIAGPRRRPGFPDGRSDPLSRLARTKDGRRSYEPHDDPDRKKKPKNPPGAHVDGASLR